MKPSDWINLGQFGLSAITGLTGGKQDERTASQLQQQTDWNRFLQQYNAQQQARSALATQQLQMNMDRAAGRQALLNASPLGAEQQLAYQMARARGLSGVAENFQPLMPASADISSLIRPTGNILSAFTTPDFRQTISPEATARSIAERRKALAGVDPTFQFGSMGDYGLPNLEKEVATYAQGVAADRLARENQLQDLLIQQAKAATAFNQPTTAAPTGVPAPTAQAPAKKKNPWWKKVLNVAATAAPIVAAPFTGGTSLALIGAGSGALKGALSGGAKGALTGAATGALTSAVGGGAAGAAAKRGAGEAASAAIKRAILNPRALTSLGGAAVGGRVEQATQAIAPFLPGAKAFKPGIVAGFENQMPLKVPLMGPGAEGFSTEFTSPLPPLASRGLPIIPIKGGYPLPAAVSQNLPFQSSGPVPAYDEAMREIALGQSRGTVDRGIFQPGRIPEAGPGGKQQLEATRRTLTGENLPFVGGLKGQDITNAIQQMNPEVLLNRMLLSDANFARYMEARQPRPPAPATPAGNLPQRNNNPGNLRDVRTGAFRKFETPEEGRAALESDLSKKFAGKTSTGLGPDSTLAQLINVWAPPSDNNDTQAYINAVSRQLGVKADTKLSQLNVQQVAQAIATQEGYYAKPQSNVVAAVRGGR